MVSPSSRMDLLWDDDLWCAAVESHKLCEKDIEDSLKILESISDSTEGYRQRFSEEDISICREFTRIHTNMCKYTLSAALEDLQSEGTSVAFLSIGPSNLRESENSEEEYFYQQFPPYLEKIMSDHPDLRVEVLLVDPAFYRLNVGRANLFYSACLLSFRPPLRSEWKHNAKAANPVPCLDAKHGWRYENNLLTGVHSWTQRNVRIRAFVGRFAPSHCDSVVKAATAMKGRGCKFIFAAYNQPPAAYFEHDGMRSLVESKSLHIVQVHRGDIRVEKSANGGLELHGFPE